MRFLHRLNALRLAVRPSTTSRRPSRCRTTSPSLLPSTRPRAPCAATCRRTARAFSCPPFILTAAEHDVPLLFYTTNNVPAKWFSLEPTALDPLVKTRSFAGVFASHRNAPAPTGPLIAIPSFLFLILLLVYSFSSFSVVSYAPLVPVPFTPPVSYNFTQVPPFASFLLYDYPSHVSSGLFPRIWSLRRSLAPMDGSTRAICLATCARTRLARPKTVRSAFSIHLTYSVQDAEWWETIAELGGRCGGLALDPSSTASSVVLWASSSGLFPLIVSIRPHSHRSDGQQRLCVPSERAHAHVDDGGRHHWPALFARSPRPWRAPLWRGWQALHCHGTSLSPSFSSLTFKGANTEGGAANVLKDEFALRPEQPLSAAILVADVNTVEVHSYLFSFKICISHS